MLRLYSGQRLLCACLLFWSGLVSAADTGFSGGVTPSRFELESTQGQLLRKSLKIYNLGARPQQFVVKTVDWSYSEAGEISFQDALAENSCREWVALERRQVTVVPDPQRPRNFRFEINVPEDAPARECRFAIMIESLEGDYAASFASGAVNMPISGRIAVVVYLGIGGVEADLHIGKMTVRRANNRGVPSLEVQNVGDAHGRLDADLMAVDAEGQRRRLSIATSPVMPGQRRFLTLTPEAGAPLVYPLRVSGSVFTDAGSMRVDQVLSYDGRGLLATN